MTSDSEPARYDAGPDRGHDGVSRRRLLALGGLGGLGAAAGGWGIAGCGQIASLTGGNPGCVLTAEQTAGPYYLDLNLVRRDITEGKNGIPLRLRTTVVDAGSCASIDGAAVEIWHCDAWGYYSSFTDKSPGGRQLPPEDGVGNNRTFLRGTQVTGKDGVAEFQTVFPGWYAPRAVHIHTRVHVGGRPQARQYAGGHLVHTGQFYFPDDVVRQVQAQQPYARHVGEVTLLADDGVYQGSGVREGLLRLTRDGGGYLATITVGVRPEAEPGR